jgi:hypothetical protein
MCLVVLTLTSLPEREGPIREQKGGNATGATGMMKMTTIDETEAQPRRLVVSVRVTDLLLSSHQ